MNRLILPLLLLLTSCAKPEVQLHLPAVQAPAIRSVQTREVFITADKTELPVRHWLPQGTPKAVIIALHGFNDYSHAFEIPGEYMKLRGIAMYAYDQRGFGHAPYPGVWPGEENLARDAGSMVVAVKKRHPHTPIYLLGESMGGAVAIAALTHPDFPPINGVILSSPALWGGDTMNPLFRVSLWMLAHTFPGKILTGEDLHILASDNIAMLRALGSDPLVIKETRTDAVYGLVRLMDQAYDRIGKVKVPMLILYGAHDQIIPPLPIVRSLRRITAANKVAYYPLGHHMLLRDLHGDVPVRDILAWIADNNCSLPSGFDVAAQQKLLK